MRPLSNRHSTGALLLESVTTGLAFGSVLCWASTCLVGSFRPQSMATPYWSGLPGVRTDTSGAVCFVIAAICLTASEYYRLRRRRDANLHVVDSPKPPVSLDPRSVRLIARAACKAVRILATGLVVYLSVNAVTHPYTLVMRATHLLPWPSEGTLRVIALILCVASAAVLRFLDAESGSTRIARH